MAALGAVWWCAPGFAEQTRLKAIVTGNGGRFLYGTSVGRRGGFRRVNGFFLGSGKDEGHVTPHRGSEPLANVKEGWRTKL